MDWDAGRSPEHIVQIHEMRETALMFVEVLVISGDPDLWMRWFDLIREAHALAQHHEQHPDAHEDGGSAANDPDP